MVTSVSRRAPQEYHIDNRTTYYQVIISWGLLDVDYKDTKFASKKLARDYCKAHAMQYGITCPIILA